MRRAAGMVSGVISTLVLWCAGCATAPSTEPLKDEMVGEWTLLVLEDKLVADLLPAGAEPPSLRVEPDYAVRGFGGVNQLSSALIKTAERDRPLFSPISATEMAGPPELMQLEAKFTELLQSANGYVGSFSLGTKRWMLYRGDKCVLVFGRGYIPPEARAPRQ